ncbi:HD domain-containing protein [Mariniblastus sp.]|nr:HD domain-containing protein [Mariniblastus sp.]MDA7901894.1 HD domain-containing protein [bacterium]MDA7924719.1 HD domain-containing protein [Mariniblastus sp.]MDC3224365.1 HD domain-containing protein [Mariniblastus sp.]
MKNKPGWLIVILISSVQLALLLFAVMMLSSWFHTQTEETIGKRTCNDNRTLAMQVTRSLNQADSPKKFDSESELQRLSKKIESITVPNGGFIVVINPQSAKILCSAPDNAIPTSFDPANIKLKMLSKSLEAKVDLLRSVAPNNRHRHFDGRAEIAGREHFVSVEFLPKLHAILMLGQPAKHSMTGLTDLIVNTQQLVFTATLLLGLVSISLIMSILNRSYQKSETITEGLESKVTQRESELLRTKNAVIFGLAKLAESRDNDTGEHLERIRSYVTIIAKDVASKRDGLDNEWVRNLGLASSLHDIGKVGVPDSILLKPGPLSMEERAVIELHTVIGGECLEAIQMRLGNNSFMHTAKQVAFFHHERWDGSGYPHGLKEEETPLTARIVAVADVYDALTSKRPYKTSFGHLESRAIIISGSGSQFDPEIVDAFLRHEDEFRKISQTQAEIGNRTTRKQFANPEELMKTLTERNTENHTSL